MALPATVAYIIAEGDAALPSQEVRPNSAFVTVDEKLQVIGSTGNLISPSLGEFLSTLENVIPGLYVKTEAAADALIAYLQENNRQDILLAAQAENAALIQKVKSALPAVWGIIDFSQTNREMTREELGQVVAATNGGGAKIALLSQETATREAVKYLQSRLMTVWVRVSGQSKDILTQLTNGANGLMTENYQSVYDALSLFDADAPILLRTPLIVGHRGLPSVYVENTLRSEKAAADAGANMLEYDIYLSADGEIFVLHDKALKRLFNRPDVSDVEALTLKELQAIPFDNDSGNGVQKKNHTPAKDSMNGVIDLSPEDRIPSLRELFEAFKDTDIIHLVEIKSQNPAIVDALKSLAEECSMVDKMAVISFNVPILRAMAENWPEMSLGCLGYDNARIKDMQKSKTLDPEKEVPYEDHAKLIEKAGGNAREALKALYAVIGPYNGAYDPSYVDLSYAMIKAGRHVGLTAWPWTYNSSTLLAQDFLFGMNGLTTNYTVWVSGLPVSFTASDGKVSIGDNLALEEVFLPVITTLDGKVYPLEGIELVPASAQDMLKTEDGKVTVQSSGECLVLLRVRIPLILDGENYGAYYLYSNPVTLIVNP